jgi:hypothetical protein
VLGVIEIMAQKKTTNKISKTKQVTSKNSVEKVLSQESHNPVISEVSIQPESTQESLEGLPLRLCIWYDGSTAVCLVARSLN